jgi:hypothetical protein
MIWLGSKNRSLMKYEITCTFIAMINNAEHKALKKDLT